MKRALLGISLDAFTKPRSKEKEFNPLQVSDFGRYQVWGFVDCDWDPARENGELLIRPLRLREYGALAGTYAIGAVLEASDGKGMPGGIVARIELSQVEVMGMAVFEAGFLSFRLHSGILPHPEREAIQRARPELLRLFPLYYETWVPIQGKLTRINGTVNAQLVSSNG